MPLRPPLPPISAEYRSPMPDPVLTVFVIDDDEDIRKSLQRALEKRQPAQRWLPALPGKSDF